MDDLGQRFSDRISASVTKVLDAITFWIVLALLALSGGAYKYRSALRTQLHIWQVRWGRGTVNDDVVAELFYRAAHLAERSASKRRPFETWREWIFGLPDPH